MLLFRSIQKKIDNLKWRIECIEHRETFYRHVIDFNKEAPSHLITEHLTLGAPQAVVVSYKFSYSDWCKIQASPLYHPWEDYLAFLGKQRNHCTQQEEVDKWGELYFAEVPRLRLDIQDDDGKESEQE